MAAKRVVPQLDLDEEGFQQYLPPEEKTPTAASLVKSQPKAVLEGELVSNASHVSHIRNEDISSAPSDDHELYNRFYLEIENDFATLKEKAIAFGKALYIKRQSLQHGEWSQLFLEGKYKFSKRTAERYLSIYEARERLKGEFTSIRGLLEASRSDPSSTSKCSSSGGNPNRIKLQASLVTRVNAEKPEEYVTAQDWVNTIVSEYLDEKPSLKKLRVENTHLKQQVQDREFEAEEIAEKAVATVLETFLAEGYLICDLPTLKSVSKKHNVGDYENT